MRPSWIFPRAIAVVVGLAMVLSGGAKAVEANAPPPPAQFYRPLTFESGNGPAFAVAIAHNAGDHAETTHEALEHGAPIIEIDVVHYRGRLYAAHDPPHSWIERLSWRLSPPATLARAWSAASAADAVQLDLKSNSPQIVELLIDFLAAHSSTKSYLVSSPDRELLTRVTAQFPRALGVLSIGNGAALARMDWLPHGGVQLRGVSVRAELLTPELVAEFHQQRLFVIAWTVDSQIAFDAAHQLQVDLIATNNLAVIERSSPIGGDLLIRDRHEHGLGFADAAF